ncbi:hypothetical protein HJB79_31530 [Rhizobium lentis]|uniref:hypothetical protein n=1 Tax=Rhizobium lentis TaxID=1138194 RepID=UPI001C83A1AB|nr:hypothetical protein [Rhizobium lentis]MBX5143242.1 hypothetical protein [Rhizobium lentis]
MPRNGSGTSSVINTFVIDTIADPDEVNANFDDVADQLTNSLPRDGQAGMNAPLPLQNGTAALPALTFTSDTDTGFYRSAANKIGIALGGVGYPLDIGVVYAAKSSDYTALATDNNAVHRFTAAATLSLTAAATLGSGWHYIVIADGGDVTIDPNGAETIDGASSVVIPNGYSALIVCSGTAFFTNKLWSLINNLTKAAAKGHLYGLTLSNNATDATNDIDITTGEAASDDATPQLMTLASGLTKRLDANWAAGTNQGMLDTGSIANGTQHIFLIKNPTTGVVDILASLSATSPTMPSGYTLKRRIGSILRESAAIVAFEQFGDKFLRTPIITRSNTAAFASALLDFQVPGGIKVRPIIRGQLVVAAGGNWTNAMGSAAFGSANDAYQNVVSTATSGDITHIDGTYTTNTASQLYFSSTATAGTSTINLVATIGWYDDRGRSL